MPEKIIQNNKNIMTNKVKVLIGAVIFIILATTIAALAIYPILNTNARFEQYKDIYDNSNFYTGGKCGFKGGYSALVKFSNRQFFELDEFNILQPTYVLIEDYDVSDYTGNNLVQHLSLMKFQRKSITEFEPIEEYGASIRNKTLAETIEIIKKYNLLEENPDPKNISISEPLPDEELAKIGERYCNQSETLNEEPTGNQEFENGTPEEKITILENEILKLKKQLENKDTDIFPDSFDEETVKIIAELEREIQQIKDENGIQ